MKTIKAIEKSIWFGKKKSVNSNRGIIKIIMHLSRKIS